MKKLTRLGGLGLCLLATACGTFGTSRQERALQRVAKDWSQLIRASQIIPVYPLTEDLLPGDVFLVQSTVEDQPAIYRQRGFLPIEAPYARLPVPGYGDHYHNFRHLKDCSPTAASGIGELLSNPPCLDKIPAAAFPSYSFEVDDRQGLGIGIPLQAINVGLDLTRSSRAVGSVSIKEAYTYGVDVRSLLPELERLARESAERLRPYRAQADEDGRRYRPQAYLRVVSRVYLARVLDVHLQSAKKLGGGADARLAPAALPLNIAGDVIDRALETTQKLDAVNCGLAGGSPVRVLRNISAAGSVSRISDIACRLPPPLVERVALQLPKNRATSALLDAAVDRGVPTSLISSLPSVRVQVSTFTDSSVGITERFERPLVVGYIAFDVPIDDQGGLGPPLPSLAVLERAAAPPVVEREREVGDWNDTLDRLLDSPRAHAAATETMRCLSRQLGRPAVLRDWNARGLGSASKPRDIHNALRRQVSELEKAGLLSQPPAQLLSRALDGRAACQ